MLPATVQPWDMAFYGPPMRRDRPPLYDLSDTDRGMMLSESQYYGETLATETYIMAEGNAVTEVRQ